MRRVGLLALALAVAAPAWAADIATLGCVSGKISADLRGRIAASYEARLRDPNIALDHALDDQIIAFGRECRTQHGWSEAAMNSAIAWTRSSIALPTAEKFARASGIDVDAVWKIWNASPFPGRGGRLEDADLATLGSALQGAGVFKKPGDPTIVGKLIAYKSTNDFTRKDFISG